MLGSSAIKKAEKQILNNDESAENDTPEDAIEEIDMEDNEVEPRVSASRPKGSKGYGFAGIFGRRGLDEVIGPIVSPSREALGFGRRPMSFMTNFKTDVRFDENSKRSRVKRSRLDLLDLQAQASAQRPSVITPELVSSMFQRQLFLAEDHGLPVHDAVPGHAPVHARGHAPVHAPVPVHHQPVAAAHHPMPHNNHHVRIATNDHHVSHGTATIGHHTTVVKEHHQVHHPHQPHHPVVHKPRPHTHAALKTFKGYPPPQHGGGTLEDIFGLQGGKYAAPTPVYHPAPAPAYHPEPAYKEPAYHPEPAYREPAYHPEPAYKEPEPAYHPPPSPGYKEPLVAAHHPEPNYHAPDHPMKGHPFSMEMVFGLPMHGYYMKKYRHMLPHAPKHPEPAYHAPPTPAYKEPAYHPEPAYKEPAYHPEPAYKEPVYHPEPAYKEPLYHPEPAYKEPAYHPEPAYKEPAYHPEPAYKEPAYHPEPKYKPAPLVHPKDPSTHYLPPGHHGGSLEDVFGVPSKYASPHAAAVVPHPAPGYHPAEVKHMPGYGHDGYHHNSYSLHYLPYEDYEPHHPESIAVKARVPSLPGAAHILVRAPHPHLEDLLINRHHPMPPHALVPHPGPHHAQKRSKRSAQGQFRMRSIDSSDFLNPVDSFYLDHLQSPQIDQDELVAQLLKHAFKDRTINLGNKGGNNLGNKRPPRKPGRPPGGGQNGPRGQKGGLRGLGSNKGGNKNKGGGLDIIGNLRQKFNKNKGNRGNKGQRGQRGQKGGQRPSYNPSVGSANAVHGTNLIGKTTGTFPICTDANKAQEPWEPCLLPGGELRGPGGLVIRPPESHPIVQIHIDDGGTIPDLAFYPANSPIDQIASNNPGGATGNNRPSYNAPNSNIRPPNNNNRPVGNARPANNGYSAGQVNNNSARPASSSYSAGQANNNVRPASNSYSAGQGNSNNARPASNSYSAGQANPASNSYSAGQGNSNSARPASNSYNAGQANPASNSYSAGQANNNNARPASNSYSAGQANNNNARPASNSYSAGQANNNNARPASNSYSAGQANNNILPGYSNPVNNNNINNRPRPTANTITATANVNNRLPTYSASAPNNANVASNSYSSPNSNNNLPNYGNTTPNTTPNQDGYGSPVANPVTSNPARPGTSPNLPTYGNTNNNLPNYSTTNNNQATYNNNNQNANALPTYGNSQNANLPSYNNNQIANLPSYNNNQNANLPNFGNSQTAANLPSYGTSQTAANNNLPSYGNSQTANNLPSYNNNELPAYNTGLPSNNNLPSYNNAGSIAPASSNNLPAYNSNRLRKSAMPQNHATSHVSFPSDTPSPASVPSNPVPPPSSNNPFIPVQAQALVAEQEQFFRGTATNSQLTQPRPQITQPRPQNNVLSGALVPGPRPPPNTQIVTGVNTLGSPGIVNNPINHAVQNPINPFLVPQPAVPPTAATLNGKFLQQLQGFTLKQPVQPHTSTFIPPSQPQQPAALPNIGFTPFAPAPWYFNGTENSGTLRPPGSTPSSIDIFRPSPQVLSGVFTEATPPTTLVQGIEALAQSIEDVTEGPPVRLQKLRLKESSVPLEAMTRDEIVQHFKIRENALQRLLSGVNPGEFNEPVNGKWTIRRRPDLPVQEPSKNDLQALILGSLSQETDDDIEAIEPTDLGALITHLAVNDMDIEGNFIETLNIF